MSDSRIEKVKKNVATSILQNFVNILISFLSRIIFVRILDESYLGINGLFSNILSILSLADLGMSNVMMYSLYRPLAGNDSGKISALISFFRRIYLGIALVILLVGLGFFPFLHLVVNLESPLPHLEVYYLIALLNVVLSYLFVYRTTLISADQKMYVTNRYTMVFKVIALLAQAMVLVLFQNYAVYLAVAVAVSLSSNLCQNAVALRMYPYLRDKAAKLEGKERRHIFRDVKAMFLYRISGTIQSNTDSILISVFVGTVYVGYYSNYSMVMGQVVGIISLVFNAAKASVGNLLASRETCREDKLFLFQVCEMVNFWIVGFCSVCFVVLFQDFIGICFGEGFLLSMTVVIVSVLNFYIGNIRQSIWIFRETTGLFHETKYITLVTAVLNIVLSLVLGYFQGMTGILAATVLARLLYAWWKEPVILCHNYFKSSALPYMVTYIKRISLCAVTCGAVYGICEWISLVNPYMEFLIHVLICCVIPNTVFLCVFGRTREFQYLKEKLGRRFWTDPISGGRSRDSAGMRE